MQELALPTVTLTGKSSMRPPLRPSYSRNDQIGVSTPLGSLSSILNSNVSGIKRKDRDFENDDEETNINVVVRCRGRNEREVRENSGVILSTNGVKGKTLELSMGPNALNNKTYNFDRVFSSAADQAMIYEDVVKPALEEMLSGYNCTIFAYGQTGTGKTYTMSGDTTEKFNLLSDDAGIIPRVLHSLFKKLEINDAEWSVKCSFIELYNEELRDLISPDDGTKLKIYDDYSNKKGHLSTIVQGMEESHVKSAAEGIKLLQSGNLKRQVASTKCNDLSSRSHTVFTVTAYIKRTAENGEDYISAGKLNLVDLAGSENIQRSGAENKRAAEAGLINKSLLTLGRVINALVDKSPHVPYRESKLTRLLQDSLGGRTKTCIIATVSPAKINLEETISTLDYAFRAKNIRNKPQVNQMVNKKTLLKEFTAEIEKLKSELIATRQRNGVYLSNESYEEMTLQSESRRILSEEQAAKIEMMEINLCKKVQELFSLTSNFTDLKKDNESAKIALEEMKTLLQQSEHALETTRKSLSDEKVLRKAHQETEKRLSNVGNELICTLTKTIQDIDGLHAKNNRNSDLQSLNTITWDIAQGHVSKLTSLVETRVEGFKVEHQEIFEAVLTRIQKFISTELENISIPYTLLGESNTIIKSIETKICQDSACAEGDINESLTQIKTLHENLKSRTENGLQELSTSSKNIFSEVTSEFNTMHSQLRNFYSKLSQDFNSLFEDLLMKIKLQHTEAESLRQQLTISREFALKSNIEASKRLEETLLEEQNQATIDRQNLLTVVTDLVKAQGELQETRFNGRIREMQKDLAASQDKFKSSTLSYEEGMKNWNEQEEKLIEEISRSREVLDNKIRENWVVIDDHSNHLHGTTKSLQDLNLQVIDSQMETIKDQVHALENLVSKVRAQNGNCFRTHESSLNNLSKSVHSTYDNIKSILDSTQDRIYNFERDVNSRSDQVQKSLESVDSFLSQPLIQLRDTVSGMHLQKYQATGETPKKTQYIYPTLLPRTDDHQKILSSCVKDIEFCSFDNSMAANEPPILSEESSLILSNQQPCVPLKIQSNGTHVNNKEQILKRSSHDLKEIDVNISKYNGMNYIDEKYLPRSKRTTSGMRKGKGLGKIPVITGKRNMMLFDGKENLNENVTNTHSSSLILPLETERLFSPRAS
ncbi:putative kinesin-like protein bimc [Erysiphe necator]|uniref:Putative kinesin-like protein bimc n=1 Tax=Uncinula necator TaxID=52586 RepID=A0A0B1PAD4_UNCNE|nr:putative kinesin-like protein bimc [Erysiphe necator]